MSKDRDSSSVSSSGLRFRNQSPANRRSRDRERNTSNKTHWERDADANTMLITNEANVASPAAAVVAANTSITATTVNDDTTDLLDDSRLSGNEELNYQSFLLDDQTGLINDSSECFLYRNFKLWTKLIFFFNVKFMVTVGKDQSLERRHHHHHHHRSNSGQAMDRLNTKIACTRESIRKEQTARDENVNEYLKLAANADADKQQLHRIKAVFEKKNQKSAHTISQLQKKLETYNKRVKEIQQNQRQMGHRQPREVLRDVGQGLK